MQEAGCVVERGVTEETRRPTDILKRLKTTLTPHYFRHNYVSLLYDSGVAPLVAMKMVGHRGHQTTANIYTHLKEDSLKKAAADMVTVFDRIRHTPRPLPLPILQTCCLPDSLLCYT